MVASASASESVLLSVSLSVSGVSYTHRSDSKSTRNTTSSGSASEDVDVDIGVGDEHINPHRGGLRRLRHRREHNIDVDAQGTEKVMWMRGGGLVVFGRYQGTVGGSAPGSRSVGKKSVQYNHLLDNGDAF